MFDWLDWGSNMAITTNELAGVNPFMGYAAGIFFFIAAVLGVYMFLRVLKKKENELLVTLFHFVSGATVFALLIMQLIAGSASGDPMQPHEAGTLLEALVLAGVTLTLGGFVWRQRLRKNRSLKLIYVHVVVALVAGGVLYYSLIELGNLPVY